MSESERQLRNRLYAIDQLILGEPLLCWFRSKANDLVEWNKADRDLAAAIVQLDAVHRRKGVLRSWKSRKANHQQRKGSL